jgi:2,7-dihydroxy-5-methyl-1-naphthoate 7-O-methyltransferase
MADEETGWGGGIWAVADLLTPMAVRVAATLRLADHIAAGTRDAAALAAVVEADADALRRLLAHLVTAGLLTRDPAGAYRLTALGEQLRDATPWLDINGAVGRADLSYVELLHTVRTGAAAYQRRYGRAWWDDLAAEPALSASFDALMADRLAADVPVLVAGYDWGALGHVVDVGGGNGSLLVAILRAHPGLRGTVLDLPHAAARAGAAIAAAGLADRAAAVPGSFFDPLPAGAGGYILSGVLNDWDDDHAGRILARCAEAAGGTGTVLVVHHFGAAAGTEGDLRMLCYTGGREQTRAELAALAARAGLHLGAVTVAGSRSIVELRPS